MGRGYNISSRPTKKRMSKLCRTSWRECMIDFFFMFGLVGGILGVGVFLPQLIKCIRTRKTRDIAGITYLILIINSIMWCVYGFSLNNYIIGVPNGIDVVLSAAIYGMKLKYG